MPTGMASSRKTRIKQEKNARKLCGVCKMPYLCTRIEAMSLGNTEAP